MGEIVVVTHSGGLDSTVLLYHLRDEGFDVRSLAIDYGQRHAIEVEYAERLCDQEDIEHVSIALPGLARVMVGSSQTDPTVPVPHGHYAEESMKATVVPNRNMLLLGTAAAWAISLKAKAVAYAAHAGDHTIYPDCRPEFAEALAKAIGLADWHHVALWRPFVEMTKADLVKRGAALGVPFALTWSCYEGYADVNDPNAMENARHCGECGTCVERHEAFDLAGVNDPTVYRA